MDVDAPFTALKAFCIAILMQTLGTYGGAISIAIIASVLKIFYYDSNCRSDCFPCCVLLQFIKYFGISLPLTLLMVHVALLYNLENQITIILSAIVAFLGKEILDIVVKEAPPIFKTFLLRSFRKD